MLNLESIPYIPLEGIRHADLCHFRQGMSCSCGAEMAYAIERSMDEIFTGPDAVDENINLNPLAEYDVVLSAATIRLLRQSLANQKHRFAR